MTEEELLSEVFQIPIERIRFLIDECGMPVDDLEFGEWMADEENEKLFLAEKEKAFNEKMGFPEEVTISSI